MLIKIFNYLFIFCAISFVVEVVLLKTYFIKIKDNVKSSEFVALITFSLAFYIIFALIITLLQKNLLMLCFALLPFVIGKLATYEKEKLYTSMQLFFVIISAFYAIFNI